MAEFSNTRVRFAPSPTGFLHVGGARTALFNWLFARATGGKFLLRIEDTDRQRSEPRFTEDIMASLKWLGFEWDEEPVYQSKRFDVYQKIADEMVAKKQAYKCDCTAEALDALRAKCEKEKRPFRYPGTCKNKTSVNTPYVLRVANPKEGETAFTDLIRGPIAFQNRDIDDWVLVRADGAPTYNFTVVIDDHHQKMTHILRGDDHINNTPKQILLYQMLGYPVPYFAHLPMILGTDKAKLSKRHGAASTLEYREMGYLPLTMINFLVRLGWSHGDQEIFKIEELFKYFALDKIGKAPAVFNPEKLNWLSGVLMRDTSKEELYAYIVKHFSNKLEFAKGVDASRMSQCVGIIQGKVKNIIELIDQMHVLFGADPTYDRSKVKPEDAVKYLKVWQALVPVIASSDCTKADLEPKVRAEAEKMGEKLAALAQPLRFAMTAGAVSPGLFEMLEVQGKEIVTRRLGKAIASFQ